MKINDKEHFIITQDVLKTEAGEILIEVDPNDILIVNFNDGFFDIESPIYASTLEEYHTPVAILKKRPDGLYEEFNIKQED